MSLRTRLLAVVVGLNGLILMLAMLFVVRAETATPPAAMAALLQPTRSEVASNLSRWDAHVDGVWMISETSVGTAEGGPTYRVYDARALIRAAAPEDVPELGASEERTRALAAYGRARREHRWVDHGLVVRALDGDQGGTRRWGLVVQVREPERGARGVYLVMLAGMVVLTLVGFLLVSRLIVRPLARLTQAAERMAAGDRDVRLPEPERDDELGRTTQAFNRMATEIAEYQTHLEDRVLKALTQIKRTEQHLNVAQRLAATGTLAAGIAHEINNPLGGMKNAVRALQRGDLPAPKTSEYLDLIGEGLARVEETVKKVLAFMPRRVEARSVDLAEVAQKALALARHRLERKSIRVEGKAPAVGSAMVFGDSLELQQVTLNLLLNAADAIDDGQHGRIEIEVALSGDHEVVLRLSDNGVGMTPEDQARCFDLFFTTKAAGEGTGLGLSVVHNIVTNHGGRVEVESERGKGSTFRIVLPRDLPASVAGIHAGGAGASSEGSA